MPRRTWGDAAGRARRARMAGDGAPDRGLRIDRGPPYGRPRRAGTAPSTGSASPISIRPPASPSSSGPTTTATGASARRRTTRSPAADGGTETRRWSSRRSSTRTRGASGSPTACPSGRATPRWSGMVEGLSGTVTVRMELVMRFDYGEAVPWVSRHDDLLDGDRRAGRPGPVAPRIDVHGEGLKSVAEFTVREGQQFPIALTWYQSHEPPPQPDRRLVGAGQHRCLVAGLVGRVHLRGRLSQRRHPLAHHLEGPHLPADRGDRRRRHDVAARDARRGAQLGLPLLLVARRHLDPRVDDAAAVSTTRPWPGATGCCEPRPAT